MARLGLIMGRYNQDTFVGDNAFDVILPNGRVCPKADHGIPDLDRGDPMVISTTKGALAEEDGVFYMCGGTNYLLGQIQDTSKINFILRDETM